MEPMVIIAGTAGALITGLVSLVSFLSIRTLRGIDKNQEILADRLNTTDDKVTQIDKDLAELKTAHNLLAPSHCKVGSVT